jgi:hypothetical protein
MDRGSMNKLTDEDNEVALRGRAIELTIKYYENKDLVPLTAFTQTLERVYYFLKDGETKSKL